MFCYFALNNLYYLFLLFTPSCITILRPGIIFFLHEEFPFVHICWHQILLGFDFLKMFLSFLLYEEHLADCRIYVSGYFSFNILNVIFSSLTSSFCWKIYCQSYCCSVKRNFFLIGCLRFFFYLFLIVFYSVPRCAFFFSFVLVFFEMCRTYCIYDFMPFI